MPVCVYCQTNIGDSKRISVQYTDHVKHCRDKWETALKYKNQEVCSRPMPQTVIINNFFLHSTRDINQYLTMIRSLPYQMIDTIDKVNRIFDSLNDGCMGHFIDEQGTPNRSSALALYRCIAEILRDKIAAQGNENLAVTSGNVPSMPWPTRDTGS